MPNPYKNVKHRIFSKVLSNFYEIFSCKKANIHVKGKNAEAVFLVFLIFVLLIQPC